MIAEMQRRAEAERHVKGHVGLLLKNLISEPSQSGSYYVNLEATVSEAGLDRGYSIGTDRDFGWRNTAAVYVDAGPRRLGESLCDKVLHGKIVEEVSPENLIITQLDWGEGRLPRLHAYALGNLTVSDALRGATDSLELYGQEIHAGVRYGEQTIHEGFASSDEIDSFFNEVAQIQPDAGLWNVVIR